MTIPSLYGFFTKILRYHMVANLPAKEIAAELGVHEFFVRDYARYAKTYSPGKLLKITEYLLEADLKSKGVNTTESDDEEIMKELFYKILHWYRSMKIFISSCILFFSLTAIAQNTPCILDLGDGNCLVKVNEDYGMKK